MADQFKQYLPDKKVGEADECTECSHPYAEHKVYPGGMCALCHDPKNGFNCRGFNLGDTVEYSVEPDVMTGKPWTRTFILGKKLKDGKLPKN